MYNIWLVYSYLPRFSRCFKVLTLVPRRLILFLIRDMPSLWKDLDGELTVLRADVEAILNTDEDRSWDWTDLVDDMQDVVRSNSDSPNHDVCVENPFDAVSATHSLLPNWRLCGWIRRVCDKFERLASQKALAEMQRASSTSDPNEHEVFQHEMTDMNASKTTFSALTDRFVRSFNPSSAGMDLLWYVERYHQRRAPGEDVVSVNLRSCLKSMMH